MDANDVVEPVRAGGYHAAHVVQVCRAVGTLPDERT